MLAMPVIAFLGAETWKVKESTADTAEFPKWGDMDRRGIIWETVTATALLQSGVNILVMRHPAAMKAVREYIDDFMTPVEVM
jgi:acetyl-CoA decarbonylase/synthase complex subunit delta